MTVTEIDFGQVVAYQNRARKIQARAPLYRGLLAQQLAEQYQALVKQHASGRPGPNIITGVYHGSIMSKPQGQGTYLVYTTQPEADRLEMGFVGVDALGRHYMQPAFPHWRPAMAEMPGKIQFIAGLWLRKVLRGA